MYYELGLKRNEIRDLLKAPDYDMNLALDELQVQLKAKRLRLEQHLAAIDQLRLIGVKNGLVELFRTAPLEELGKNLISVIQSDAESWWVADIQDTDLVAFGDFLELYLTELNRQNEKPIAEETAELIIGKLFRKSAELIGLPGFLFVFGLFLSTIGEGHLPELGRISIPLSPAHAQIGLQWLKQDADLLLSEVAKVIADHHDALNCPVDSPETCEIANSIMAILKTHYGLSRKQEYRLIFDHLPFDHFGSGHGYLKYVLDALKFYSETP